ncbi:hypothetical protein F3J37_01895 [Pantoea sp. Al-1710]|uniref:Uncharacterized protein n=1 Tax=Candidatus Pantoea communis TaxID=2608354 RepID=A0ABX0RIJ1_9GAMM|nr:hypothetical protein [Pantoea communis]NIG17431.1 hypothetical protein [Pantoea communis]
MQNYSNKALMCLIYILGGISFVFLVAGNLPGAAFAALLTVGGVSTYRHKKNEFIDAGHRLEYQKNSNDIHASQLLVSRINSGDLPVELSLKALLKKNEVCHFSTEAELYEMRSKRYSTGSGSARVRVAKGFSVSTGSTRSYHTERILTKISMGELSITNKRVIFSGSEKSFECPIGKVINADDNNETLVIQYGNEPKYLNMDIGKSLIAVAVLKKLISQI